MKGSKVLQQYSDRSASKAGRKSWKCTVYRSVGCSGSGSRRRDEFKGKHGGVTVTDLLSAHLQIDEGLMDWRSVDGPSVCGDGSDEAELDPI
ncbi:hypothetical protein PIB30_060954 [Stylosanthes scabra]|uniref:Uncharacterized protein n=1 Tax=Stylosanthes scabra TaxID=79078 RepID=A0ABU6ZJG3_9FABA|nr:hypothetical protein [Stylosanthes scabra]